MNNEEDFSIVKIAPDTYMCREKHYGRKWNIANLYVVRGTKMDLIIDTGLGLWDFKKFLLDQELISESKPYLAVVTHVHFDHAGGLYQFSDNCAIHVHEQKAIESGDNVVACTFLTQSDCAKNPPTPDWKASDYTVRPVKPTRILKGNQDSFDLGNGRIIHVIHTPGHSRGSIVLWDEQNGFLFSGDTVYDAEVLDYGPSSDIQDYLRTMDKLSNLASKVARVFPGHGDEFDGQCLREIADNYIESTGICHTCSSTIMKSVATVLLRGRNAKDAKFERCCYHACCFPLVFGPAVKDTK